MTTKNPPNDPTTTGRDTATNPVETAEQQAKFADQIVQAKIMTNEQLLRQKQIQADINKSLGEAYQAQKRNLESQQILISNYAADVKEAVKDINTSEAAIAALSKKYEDFAKGNKLLFEEIATAAKTLSPEEFAAKIESIKGELVEAKSIGDNFNGSLTSMTKAFGFAAKSGDTFSGALLGGALKLTKFQSAAARKEAFDSLGNSFKETLSPLNLMSSLFDNLIKTALEFDKAAKKLSSSFGELGAYQDLLISNSAEITKMGLTAADQGTIVSTLATGFAGLSRQTIATQESLKLNTATLESLGGSATNAAKMLTVMSVGMGRNAKDVSNLTLALAGNSKAFGMTAGQIVEDFASMSSSLAGYGDEMERVFLDLAEQSKRTGIAITQLNAIAESFDKFSGAATKAGQVNALFGTSISSMAMTSMDAGQRMEYLQQQLGHLSVDNMSRYQKLALKDAMGFQSVGEAVQFLGGALSDEEQAQIDAVKLQKEMGETMRDVAKATLPLTKQLAVMFADLTSNSGTIDAIVNGLRSLSSLLLFATENIYTTIAALVALKTIGIVMPPILSALAAGTFAWGTATNFALGAFGILLVVLGALFYQFHKTASPAFYLLFGVIAVGIFAMGMAAQATQPGLYAIAAAALAVGLGLSAIFYTVSMVVDSLTGLFEVLSKGATDFPMAAAGIYAISGGMAALAGTSAVAATGLTAALAALTAMKGVLNFGDNSFDDLVKTGDQIAKIGGGIGSFGSGLQKIKSAAAELKSAVGDSMIMASMEGQKMSVVIGRDAAVATLFKNDTLNIKVDMPKINIPAPKFEIYIDGKAIDARIEQRYNK